VRDGVRIGRVHGAKANSYTAGVICAKVGRYAERIHHPDRLTRPLLRVGPKGAARFRAIGWDEALDRIAERVLAARGQRAHQLLVPPRSVQTTPAPAHARHCMNSRRFDSTTFLPRPAA